MTWPLLFGTTWLLVGALSGLVVGGAIRSAEDVAVPAQPTEREAVRERAGARPTDG